MRRLAEAIVPDDALGADGLAEGIARYVELCRVQSPARDLETIRLVGDLTAERFGRDYAPQIVRRDSYVVVSGREIPVRIFDPGGPSPRPGICYFHGGGFSMGSVASFDIVCAALAQATGAVVVSGHYRRLPEAGYAAAQEDCDQVFAWTRRQSDALALDPARIAVAGDSAGALLALAVAANARDSGAELPACQLLFYGTFAMDPERPAYAASRDPLLTADRVRGYVALFRSAGGLDRLPAPIDRVDLNGLPPTHIVAAELDPLCSEAEEFAAKLGTAGVVVSVRRAPGMIHGFLRAVGVSTAARTELSHAALAVHPFLRG